jgi:hypothetical protein
MPDLDFQIEGVEIVAQAASPLLALKLRVRNADELEPIQTVALRCQIQLEAARRRYNEGEQERLLDLFGQPQRWGRTLRPLLWTNTSLVVPPFTDSKVVDLQLPCTFDFNLAATKYFAALEEGSVPLTLLFSGTIFYKTENGALQIAQIPWEKEARYSLPVSVWRELMEIYYRNTAWLCLRRDVFDRLSGYKTRRGLPTFEQTLERLLTIVDEVEFEGPRLAGPNGAETAHR